MPNREPTSNDILAAIQSLALNTEQRFAAVDAQFADMRDQIATSHDEIIGRLERVEQELTFTNVAVQRHEEHLTPTHA